MLRKTPRLRLGSTGEAPFAMSAGKAGSRGWVPTFPPPSPGPFPLMFLRMVGFFGGCPESQALLFAEGTPAKEGLPTWAHEVRGGRAGPACAGGRLQTLPSGSLWPKPHIKAAPHSGTGL